MDDDASVEDIKNAYRYLAKQCHPDYLGNEGHDMCVLLNEVSNLAPADHFFPPLGTRRILRCLSQISNLGLEPSIAHFGLGLHVQALHR